MAKDKSDPFVGIAASVTALLIPIVLFMVAFAGEHKWVVAPVVASVAIMGIGLGYFASISKKRR